MASYHGGVTAFALFDATPRPINSITKTQTQRGMNQSIANWNTTPLFVSLLSLCFIFQCHTKSVYPSLLIRGKARVSQSCPMIVIGRRISSIPSLTKFVFPTRRIGFAQPRFIRGPSFWSFGDTILQPAVGESQNSAHQIIGSFIY